MVETVIIDHDMEMEPIVLQSGWSFVVARTGDDPEVRQLLIGNANIKSMCRTLGLAFNALMKGIEKESGIPRFLMLHELLDGMLDKDFKEMMNGQSDSIPF